MTIVKEIMTREPAMIHIDQPLVVAAIRMRDADIGALFAVDGDEWVGVVTDRDIAIRGIAKGRTLHSTCVIDVMTRHIVFCSEDDPVEEASARMLRQKVRRLAVVDANREINGVLALADLVRAQAAEEPSSTAAAEMLRALTRRTDTAKTPVSEGPTGGRWRGSPPGVPHVYASRPRIRRRPVAGIK